MQILYDVSLPATIAFGLVLELAAVLISAAVSRRSRSQWHAGRP